MCDARTVTVVSEQKQPLMPHEDRRKLIESPVSFWVGRSHSWGGSGITDWFFTEGKYRAYSYHDPRFAREERQWLKQAND